MTDGPSAQSHIHVSLRDRRGNNAFSVKPEELQGGREGAAYDELKYISQTAEHFLSGVLDGLTDGKSTVDSRGQAALTALQLCQQ